MPKIRCFPVIRLLLLAAFACALLAAPLIAQRPDLTKDRDIHLSPTGGNPYIAAVLADAPSHLWVLDDALGSSVARDTMGRQNGAIVGVKLGEPPLVPSLTASGWWDQINDYIDVLGEGLIFSGSEGSLEIIGQVDNPGVWTDGTGRGLLRIWTDSNNYIDIAKWGTNNTLGFEHMAGGTYKAVSLSTSTLDPFHAALTWSASNNEMRAYFNGQQSGSTQTGLGTWAGALTIATIGARSTTPTNVWHGWLQAAAIYDQAKPESVWASHWGAAQ